MTNEPAIPQASGNLMFLFTEHLDTTGCPSFPSTDWLTRLIWMNILPPPRSLEILAGH